MPNAPNRKRDLITQTAAADLIEVARGTVLAMIARGELEGELVAGIMFVDRASAEAAAEARRVKLTTV
jgi:hypothetical protein